MTSAPWRSVKVNDWVPLSGWPFTVLITLASPMTVQLALADFVPIVSLSPYFGSSVAEAFTVLGTVAAVNGPLSVTVTVLLAPAARLKVPIPSSAVMTRSASPVLVKVTLNLAGPACGTGWVVQVLLTVKAGWSRSVVHEAEFVMSFGNPLGW